MGRQQQLGAPPGESPGDEAGGEIIDEDADATCTLDATDQWRFRDVQDAEEHESCGDDQDQHGAGVDCSRSFHGTKR